MKSDISSKHPLLIGQHESHVIKWMDFLSQKHSEIYLHCVRVAILADKMATQLKLSSSDRRNLVIGCFLHDLGKAFMPRSIIQQKGELSPEQWRVMKLHPLVGVEMVESKSGLDSASIEVIHYHHERWDGTGYPDGLAGDRIPLFARICAILDAFDAMISDRPYKPKLTTGEAMGELLLGSGSQFDPTMVNLFLSLSDTILDYY